MERALPDHSGEGRPGLKPPARTRQKASRGPHTGLPEHHGTLTVEANLLVLQASSLVQVKPVARKGDNGRMHLVPAEHAHRHTIDEHAVCDAIQAIADPDAVHAWAQRHSLLADPRRLSLLLAIRAVPDISVTDLAIAAGMNDTAVSQALRLLRVAGAVAARKDGRVVRYRIADSAIADLLPAPQPLPQHAGTDDR
jgi:DNA-binding transcriptional ArsR family regulator